MIPFLPDFWVFVTLAAGSLGYYQGRKGRRR